MADQKIRDKNNRLIATIKARHDGKLEIRDPNNRALGTYDPKTDQTRNMNNALVAKGNVLTSLIRVF